MYPRCLLTTALLLTIPLARGGAQAAPAMQTAPTAQRADSAAVLMPGDVLRLTVWQRPELSGDFTVGGDGALMHPVYHALRVAGVPLPAVEGAVREFLKTYVVEPQVTVQPLLRVGVSGEVHAPGVLLVAPSTTLPQIVAMSGGPTDHGAMNRVRLVRANHQSVVDLSGALRPGTPLVVRSGDQLWVDKETSLLRDHIAPLASVAVAAAATVYYGFKRR